MKNTLSAMLCSLTLVACGVQPNTKVETTGTKEKNSKLSSSTASKLNIRSLDGDALTGTTSQPVRWTIVAELSDPTIKHKIAMQVTGLPPSIMAQSVGNGMVVVSGQATAPGAFSIAVLVRDLDACLAKLSDTTCGNPSDTSAAAYDQRRSIPVTIINTGIAANAGTVGTTIPVGNVGNPACQTAPSGIGSIASGAIGAIGAIFNPISFIPILIGGLAGGGSSQTRC